MSSVINLQEYTDIKEQIKELTKKAKAMEPQILASLLESESNRLETDRAEFLMRYKPKWEYSEELTTQEERTKLKLKQMKKDEELSGKATKITDGGYLVCQFKKA